MRKTYTIKADAAVIAFENIPAEFIRDWLINAARQRLAHSDRDDATLAYAEALAKAARIVQANWALDPIDDTDPAMVEARAQGWETENERYGAGIGSGVVHPDGRWAASFTTALPWPTPRSPQP